jgi:hypothetical protein
MRAAAKAAAQRAVAERAAVDAAAAPRRAAPALRLPCMVYAAVSSLPDISGLRLEAAIAEVRRAPGVLQVLRFDAQELDDGRSVAAGLGVVTRGHWLARQSLARLMSLCAMKPAPLPAETCDAALAGTGGCTAQFVDGCLRVWVATSDPARAAALAARLGRVNLASVDLRIVGTPPDDADMRMLAPAIALARELQPAPVQILLAHERSLDAQERRDDVPTPDLSLVRNPSEALAA